MNNHPSILSFVIDEKHNDRYRVRIIIPTLAINTLFDQAALSQQPHVMAPGFAQGNVPISYVRQEFRTSILTHLKEFLLKYAVINCLYKNINKYQLVVTGEPKLIDIDIANDQDGQFVFDIPIFPKITIQDWRYFPFKAPKRKNYRDIDRQVDNFIKEEQSHECGQIIQKNDWIHFSVTIFDQNNQPLIHDFTQNFWLNLGNEEINSRLQELFLEKTCGESFIASNSGFSDYFTTHLDGGFSYLITILHVVPYTLFSFDRFKKHFKIKTNKDMHKKLIEVFSFRNDLSQRHCMVSEAFKTLLSKHQFCPPQQLVSTQKKIILSAIKQKPDYTVYKKQKEFDTYVHQLAEQQTKEFLFTDQLAYYENIQTTDEDVCNYLNLLLRPRTKSFVHFQPPTTRHSGQEVPIATERIKQSCLREKTINHAIYHLIK